MKAMWVLLVVLLFTLTLISPHLLHAGMFCLVFVFASLFGPMLRSAPRAMRGRSRC